jgi:subtilisin family serine protease
MKVHRVIHIVASFALFIASVVWGVAHVTAWDLSAYMAARTAPLSASQRRIASPLRAAAALVARHGTPAVSSMMTRTLRLSDEGIVDVYVHTYVLTQAEIHTLQQHGVHIYRAEAQFRMVHAAIALNALETVAALPFVHWIGLPSYSALRTGSVTSAGDGVLRAAEARATFGIDGSGVQVGIISDSFGDFQDAVASGDLPPAVVIPPGGDVFPGRDEGRAMAEIIHDLAPGAALLFYTGFSTNLDMVRAIQTLTAAGAHIIVDDLGFFTEPVFEHGPVAQAVQEAIAQGVVYVTATGNEALQHYRASYKEFDPNDGNPEINLHDFGPGDATMAVTIDPASELLLILQWPDPFDGSANTADYDLLVFDTAGRAIALSTEDQLNSNAPPLEGVQVNNPTPSRMTVQVQINRVAGPALPLVLNFSVAGTPQEHNVVSGSVFGHPCVPEALAVGAIWANDPGFDAIEAFSSRGPCELFFPTYAVHTKPDIVAADGVQTSLPGFQPFFGTSAAAPHVAAIAALLIDAAGGPGMLSNTQIAHIIRLAARDRGIPEHDNTFGHGAVDTVAAVMAVQALLAGSNSPPQSTIDAPATNLVIVPGASVVFQGTCTDAENNGPFTVLWDFGGVAPVSNLEDAGAIVFPNAGVFPVSFTCVDAAGVPDPSPATRTITVNQAPGGMILSPSVESTVAVGSSVDFTGMCSDAEDDAPFAFLWFFGGGADIASSTQQNPRSVRFNSMGTFLITLICTDALGLIDPLPATVQIQVTSGGEGGGGGGGGGCAMLPGGVPAPAAFLAAFGNILLPVVALCLIRGWFFYRARRAAKHRRSVRAAGPQEAGRRLSNRP